MEETLEKNTNEQIEMLQIRIDLIEKDLEVANDRAMKAEEELRELRRSFRASQVVTCVECANKAKKLVEINEPAKPALPPPPPPPPLPIAGGMIKVNSNSIDTLNGAISSCSLNKIDDEDKNKHAKNTATGKNHLNSTSISISSFHVAYDNNVRGVGICNLANCTYTNETKIN